MGWTLSELSRAVRPTPKPSAARARGGRTFFMVHSIHLAHTACPAGGSLYLRWCSLSILARAETLVLSSDFGSLVQHGTHRSIGSHGQCGTHKRFGSHDGSGTLRRNGSLYHSGTLGGLWVTLLYWHSLLSWLQTERSDGCGRSNHSGTLTHLGSHSSHGTTRRVWLTHYVWYSLRHWFTRVAWYSH